MIIRRNPRGPQVGQSQLHLTHPRQDGRGGVDGRARQGLVVVRISGIPERLPTGQSKAVEGSSRGQGFGLRHREPYPAYYAIDIGERLPPALQDNPLGQLAADALYFSEPEPDREVTVTAMFERSIRSRPYEGPYLELNTLQTAVKTCWAAALGMDQFKIGINLGLHDVGTQYRYAVPARISDQRLRRVEAHRLCPQQTGQKGSWIVQLEPGGGIDQQGEADRMALGESKVGKGLDSAVDVVS